MHPTTTMTYDDPRRELRQLLEGMKAQPERRQMEEAQRFVEIQRSIARAQMPPPKVIF